MSYYKEHHEEWLQQFSIEKNIGNLFLIKNNSSGTFTIATNFCLKNCSYTGQIFFTTTKKELALQAFAETFELTQSNNKVGAMP